MTITTYEIARVDGPLHIDIFKSLHATSSWRCVGEECHWLRVYVVPNERCDNWQADFNNWPE